MSQSKILRIIVVAQATVAWSADASPVHNPSYSTPGDIRRLVIAFLIWLLCSSTAYRRNASLAFHGGRNRNGITASAQAIQNQGGDANETCLRICPGLCRLRCHAIRLLCGCARESLAEISWHSTKAGVPGFLLATDATFRCSDSTHENLVVQLEIVLVHRDAFGGGVLKIFLKYWRHIIALRLNRFWMGRYALPTQDTNPRLVIRGTGEHVPKGGCFSVYRR
jgi:hypothetical protein